MTVYSLKFCRSQQLCNSVSILISPDELGGESWETRRSLGLRPGKDFLAVRPYEEWMCKDLQSKVLN